MKNNLTKTTTTNWYFVWILIWASMTFVAMPCLAQKQQASPKTKTTVKKSKKKQQKKTSIKSSKKTSKSAKKKANKKSDSMAFAPDYKPQKRPESLVLYKLLNLPPPKNWVEQLPPLTQEELDKIAFEANPLLVKNTPLANKSTKNKKSKKQAKKAKKEGKSAFEASPQKTSNELPLNIQPFRSAQSKTSIFYLLLLTLMILAYLNYNFPPYLKGIYNAFKNKHLAHQFYEDYNHRNLPLNILFNINIVLLVSLLCFLLIRYFDKLPSMGNASLIWLLIALVTVALGIRYTFLYFVSIALPISKPIQLFLFNLRISHIILSILLIPALFFIAFSQGFVQYLAIIWTLCLIVIILVRTYFRGFSIGQKIILFHKFHFFLYFCALEIAPLLIIYKFAQRFIV